MHGYFDVTVLNHVAANESITFSEAYDLLYNSNSSNADAVFRRTSLEAMEAAQAAEKPIYVFFLYASLLQLSKDVHTKDNFTYMGNGLICNECYKQLLVDERPDYSMCGKFKCNFGSPYKLDNLPTTKENLHLTRAEELTLAQSRPYVHMLKSVKDPSPFRSTAMKGNIITFRHESELAREACTQYPRFKS